MILCLEGAVCLCVSIGEDWDRIQTGTENPGHVISDFTKGLHINF